MEEREMWRDGEWGRGRLPVFLFIPRRYSDFSPSIKGTTVYIELNLNFQFSGFFQQEGGKEREMWELGRGAGDGGWVLE